MTSESARHEPLSSYFTGIAVKRLTAVEINPNRSNQHELNGVQDLQRVFGEGRQTNIPASFVYLGESEEDTTGAQGFATWYDARENHPTRSEHRLYFAPNAAMEEAEEGDLIFICRRSDGTALFVISRFGSSSANQLQWLFGLTVPQGGLRLQKFDDQEEGVDQPDFIRRAILEQIGIEPAPVISEEYLPELLNTFGSTFPTTRVFSNFARSTLSDVSAADNPDEAIMSWMEREESLFRTLEWHIVSSRLERGFGTNVDVFVEFSLSVHNRRKSRAGFALENHLEQIFEESRIRFSRNKVTERKSRPDFIFPGIVEYHNERFEASRLSMLGVKSTCKDRWRQVLPEAERILSKHLFTLEPAISGNQTSQMRAASLQLVLPSSLHSTYSPEQRKWLMTLREFIELVRKRDLPSTI